MGYNIFLDTNILVDFFAPERKEHNNCVQLFQAAHNFAVTIFLSESVINTTAYLVSKGINIQIFKRAIIELTAFAKILPCTNAIIRDAYKNAANDLEDAVLYQIALEGKMDYFVTSNIRDFKKLEQHVLPVVTSKKMVDILA